jgi:hypothetical protein
MKPFNFLTSKIRNKEDLFAYARNKSREINFSDTGLYVHKDVYKAIVCSDIRNGIITTYEEADKAIEYITTTNPLDFAGQVQQQMIDEMEDEDIHQEDELIQLKEDLN